MLVGKVDGRGYDDQQKDAICDVRGRCQTISSIFSRFVTDFRLIGYTYELLRCLDVEIWRFSSLAGHRLTDRQTITLPLCMRAG